ncbi:MAG: acyltransferase family protein [Parvularcula sp.]|jgi:peptidoglycan/LPS O-acetylase OafA/YrhL|nr:acyltransferase family protein [Parvularcula sp.]
MALKYRAEIDGLRAVAVLAVIIYHMRLPFGEEYLLRGGFLGVDVFFVLSGFLITSIIKAEITQTGEFEWGNFYLRRARRILPPLLLVIFASLPVAYLILLPTEMHRFAESLWSALGFYSNFFWYFELGDYGSQDGLLQPFLHTWSLAIEEQFYIVFPIVLVLVFRWFPQRILAVLVFLMLAGLLLAQMTTFWKPDLSFFAPTSRAWELLAGAALAFYPSVQPRTDRVGQSLRYLPTIGMAAILLSLFLVPLDSSFHVGLATVPAIAGTAVIIAFANASDYTTRILSTAPMVFVGKLSYSLYLWHFPIFAFARLNNVGEPSVAGWSVCIALTFALSYLGYILIEKPLRFSVRNTAFLKMIGTACLLVIILPFGLRTIDMDRAPRANALAKAYGGNDYDNERLQMESWSVLARLARDEDISSWNAHEPSMNERSRLWFSRGAAQRVLLIGNSHSKDMFNALYLNREKFAGVEFARFALAGALESEQLSALYASPNYQAADTIALAPKWGRNLDEYGRLIEKMKRDGKSVVIIDNTAEFGPFGRVPLYDGLVRSSRKPIKPSAANRAGWENLDEEVGELNAELRRLAVTHDAAFYSRFELVCVHSSRNCSILGPAGEKTMFDYGHWTLDGARLFGARAANEGWFVQPSDTGPMASRLQASANTQP